MTENVDSDMEEIDSVEDAFFVYCVLDLLLLNEYYKKGDKIGNSAIVNSIVYVGSGDIERMREHVYFSKSQCPTKAGNNFHEYVSPTSFYVCSSVHDSEHGTDNVLVLPMIVVNSDKFAKKVETALITYLSDLLVNFKDIHGDEIVANQETYFLAHYALENFFRFSLPVDFEDGFYKFSDFPYFNLHELHSFGSYGDSNSPKKLSVQNDPMYKHTVASGKHSHTLNVRLPLHNFDFSLNNEQSKKALLGFIEEATVSFLFNLIKFVN